MLPGLVLALRVSMWPAAPSLPWRFSAEHWQDELLRCMRCFPLSERGSYFSWDFCIYMSPECAKFYTQLLSLWTRCSGLRCCPEASWHRGLLPRSWSRSFCTDVHRVLSFVPTHARVGSRGVFVLCRVPLCVAFPLPRVSL